MCITNVIIIETFYNKVYLHTISLHTVTACIMPKSQVQHSDHNQIVLLGVSVQGVSKNSPPPPKTF